MRIGARRSGGDRSAVSLDRLVCDPSAKRFGNLDRAVCGAIVADDDLTARVGTKAAPRTDVDATRFRSELAELRTQLDRTTTALTTRGPPSARRARLVSPMIALSGVRLTRPVTPWSAGPWIMKSAAASSGPLILGRMPA